MEAQGQQTMIDRAAMFLMVGMPVIYRHDKEINGTKDHPAIVTRICDRNSGCVNLHVFWDGIDGACCKQTSVKPIAHMEETRCWMFVDALAPEIMSVPAGVPGSQTAAIITEAGNVVPMPDSSGLIVLNPTSNPPVGSGAFLYGSSTLDAVHQIGGKEVPLGDVVRAAHERSGLDVAEWNDLTEAARDDLLNAELRVMHSAATELPTLTGAPAN